MKLSDLLVMVSAVQNGWTLAALAMVLFYLYLVRGR
jgi:hypothetical protein